MSTPIALAPGAENNAFASMLADLVRQNLESKPHKKKDFDALEGTVALVADDADVALTLEFKKGELVLHDGIRGVPDVAVGARHRVGGGDPGAHQLAEPGDRPQAR